MLASSRGKTFGGGVVREVTSEWQDGNRPLRELGSKLYLIVVCIIKAKKIED